MRIAVFTLAITLSGLSQSASPQRAVRLKGNPIIAPGITGLPEADAGNINGPSLIRVPPWAPNRLGKYYLYFAHHNGKYIRLAYGDSLSGPWKIHPGGVLGLADAGFDHHIASPDVHVDEERRQIIMYYHGLGAEYRGRGYQPTRVALSTDGLRFEAKRLDLGDSYFRVFRWKSECYALARAGKVYRAKSCAEPWSGEWEAGGNPFERPGEPSPRHVAVLVEGDTLTVYYSRIGDMPEHLQVSTIELKNDWKNWRASEPVSLLRPQESYEGAGLPVRKSTAGLAREPVHELRDPAIFVEGKRKYLLYSVAGEGGIAIAELR
jgi:hypothetical protein